MDKPKLFYVKKYLVLVIILLTLIAVIVETAFFIWLFYHDKNGKTGDIHMGLPHAESAKIRVSFLFLNTQIFNCFLFLANLLHSNIHFFFNYFCFFYNGFCWCNF